MWVFCVVHWRFVGHAWGASAWVLGRRFAFHLSVLKRSSHDCGLLVFCGFMTSFTCCSRSASIYPPIYSVWILYTCSFLPHPQLSPSGVCWVQKIWKILQKNKNRKKKKESKKWKEVFFYLPFGEMHCSDQNKEKVHLVCWIMCKLVITQSEYLYNCLYFFIMILERNVFIFLTSVPDVSSVGLTLWLVWWDSYLCIEPLLWWILCMQCLGNTVGNMGRSWY